MPQSMSESVHYKIALIPGDGIGQEVIPEGVRVLQALAGSEGYALEFTEFPWSCEYYRKYGRMMPEDGLERLRPFDAILLGAVGLPDVVPDHLSLRGLLIPIRQTFDQYVNLRPSRPLAGIPTPLRGDPAFDWLMIRENSEGEYAGLGGRFHPGTPEEVALQTTLFTRRGVERIIRYAFKQAAQRSGRLASATKSNAMQFAFVMWDEIVDSIAPEFPTVQVKRYHVDALAARMVTHPHEFDVIVASNLLGDILTDLAGALQGSLGLPASGNINPDRTAPSMFEPVHGSAPDIAGRGLANPIATFWACAMMLEHLGQSASAVRLYRAIEQVTGERKTLTADVGGHARMTQVTEAVLKTLGTKTSVNG